MQRAPSSAPSPQPSRRGRRPHPLWNLDEDFTADLAARGELQTVLDLIGRFSLWVDPRVSRAVPVVFPKTARLVWGRNRYGDVVNGVRLWMNQPAQEAVFKAIDSSPTHFRGANVCHIYPKSPYLPQHFTRLSNLIVVPSPLAAFTEWGPVLSSLQRRSFELYRYTGPERRTPERPSLMPARWASPIALAKDRRLAVVSTLEHLRRSRPTWANQRHPLASRFGRDASRQAFLGEAPAWRAERDGYASSPALWHHVKNPRQLDEEFWKAIDAAPILRRVLVSWFVRHAFLASPEVVRILPNPFPATRRLRLSKREKVGQIVDGITLGTSTPAATALMVAIGATLSKTRGGSVDHAWRRAAYLPAHNCHLGGLVLLPQALGSMADAEPMGGILRRHLFELHGYKGPFNQEPRLPEWMPEAWPLNRPLSPDQEAKAIATLKRYLRERPQYYRKWKPGGAGRPPR
jgi:hypothetical protein